MQYLSTLDYIIFILFMVGGVWVAMKGFFNELSTKFGYVLGFILALMFTHSLSPVFLNRLGFPSWFSAFISYFLIFIVGYLLMRGFGTVLSNILDTAHLTAVDKFLGFFFGLAEVFLILVAAEFILGYQDLFNLKQVFDESLLSSRLILPVGEAIASTIKGFI